MITHKFPEFDSLFSPIDEKDYVRIFRNSIQNFVTKEIMPIADGLDLENNFPQTLWPKLGSMGLLGITVPEAYGGINSGYLTQAIAMEEISRGSAAIGLSYAAHANLCINQIVSFGNSTQKSIYLPKLIAGTWIGALAISEEQAGSDALSMSTTATIQDDYFELNGKKMWITNGPEADLIITYAKTDPKLGSKGISAFIVPGNTPGLIRGAKLDKLGMRGSNTCELTFKHCKIPAANLLGKLDQGTAVLMHGLNYERLILAAGPIGIIQACMDLVLPYIKQRKQFGKPIGEFQLIQSKIANFYTYLNAGRAYLYTLAKLTDQTKQLTNKDAASVILFTAEHATKIALETIQILGANGYCNEYAAGRLLRDAKLYEIGAGSKEIRKIIIAKELYAL